VHSHTGITLYLKIIIFWEVTPCPVVHNYKATSQKAVTFIVENLNSHNLNYNFFGFRFQSSTGQLPLNVFVVVHSPSSAHRVNNTSPSPQIFISTDMTSGAYFYSPLYWVVKVGRRGGGGAGFSYRLWKVRTVWQFPFFPLFFLLLYKRNVLRVRSSLTTFSIEASCTAVCLDNDISL